MDDQIAWALDIQQNVINDMEKLLPKLQRGQGSSDMQKLIEELSRISQVIKLYLDYKG